MDKKIWICQALMVYDQVMGIKTSIFKNMYYDKRNTF